MPGSAPRSLESMSSMIRLSSTAPPRPRSSKAVLATVAPAPIAMPQGEQPAKTGAMRRRSDASRLKPRPRIQPTDGGSVPNCTTRPMGLVSRAPGIGDMAGPAPGGHQNDVETAAAGLKLRPEGEISRRGPGDPPALARKQRFRRRGDIRPRLDLDEGQDGPAPGDDVDLARGGAVIAGED